MNSPNIASAPQRATKTHLARTVFFAFLLTFLLSRISVFLIMARWIPDLYLHLGGSHIHHLNHGIFLLAGVGGFLIFGNPQGRGLQIAAACYGIGMGLTFDEFGMWVHLGGAYWQRASLDAVVVIGGLFGLAAYAPSIQKLQPRQWWSACILLVLLVLFTMLLADSFKYAGRTLGPKLHRIEANSPP